MPSAPSAPHEELVPSPRIGTAEHFRWLHGIVCVVLVLNLVDAVFTLLWVGAGLAREANPLLAHLVRQYPVGFALAKLGLVGLSSVLLWRLRHRPLAVVSIFCSFVVYYLVLLHHLSFLGTILRAWLAG
jgi:hypothetical protein